MTPRIRSFAVATFLAVLSLTIAPGCRIASFFGPNFHLNVSIPLGLNGLPGVLNPFGIVQALVNTWLETALPDAPTPTAGADDDTTPPDGATPPVIS